MNADDIARLRAATKKDRIKITSRITIRNRIKSRSRNYSVAKKLAKKTSFCRCVLRIGGRKGVRQEVAKSPPYEAPVAVLGRIGHRDYTCDHAAHADWRSAVPYDSLESGRCGGGKAERA